MSGTDPEDTDPAGTDPESTDPAGTDPESADGGGFAAVAERYSSLESVGGVRGLVESALPTVVFTGAYVVARSIATAAVGAVAVAVVAVAVRALTRRPIAPAASGLVGVAAGAAIAYLSGRAVNYFLLAIVKNLGCALLLTISCLVRWPAVGVMVGPALREQFRWRAVPARRRAYQRATWLWVGMFVLRLAVEVPLYLHDRVGGLGVASVPLGLPLFALVLLATWFLVRRVPVVGPGEQAVVGPGRAAVVDPTAGAVAGPVTGPPG